MDDSNGSPYAEEGSSEAHFKQPSRPKVEQIPNFNRGKDKSDATISL